MWLWRVEVLARSVTRPGVLSHPFWPGLTESRLTYSKASLVLSRHQGPPYIPIEREERVGSVTIVSLAAVLPQEARGEMKE